MNRRIVVRAAVLVLIPMAFARPAFASVELFADGPASASVGQLLNIGIRMQITDSVNAIQTTLQVNPEDADIESYDDSSSAIRLWLQHPATPAHRSVRLEGLIPGGIGPGLTNVVPLGTLHVIPRSTGMLRISFTDSMVYANQSRPTQETVTSRTFEVRTLADSGTVPANISDAIVIDSDVRIVRDGALYSGTPTLVFDVKTDQGSALSLLLRERFLGLFGSWRTVESPVALSDSTGLSILDTALPDSFGGAAVARIIPARLKIVWCVLFVLLLLISRRMYMKRR